MALQGQTVDVPLAPMNQQATAIGGPVGRIRALTNMIVKKVMRGDAGSTLRVEKRDGFEALPTAVRDPATGAVSPKTLLGPKLIATWKSQLVAVFLAAPFVLSEAAGCWESPTYTAPAQTLRQRGVFVGNTVLASSDSARIGSRTMHVWADAASAPAGNVPHFQITDDDGTVILKPTSLDIFQSPVKVATDGTQFWIIMQDLFGNLVANVYDANGALLGANNTVVLAAPGYFDVVADTTQLSNGVFAVQKDGGGSGGVKFTRFVWTGAAVTATSTVQAAFLCSTGKLGFFRSDRGDGNLYLGTVDGGATQIHGWQVTAPGAGTFGNGHHYVVRAAGGVDPFELTGFVAQTGNADLTVAASYLDATPHPQLNLTEIRTVTFAGVATLVATKRALTVVSRPFLLDSGYYLAVYYRSDPTNSFTQIQQSTFFLLALSAPWQVCGRWEYGTAYADATDTVTTKYYFALSSPNIAPNGGWHVPLLYRAQSAFKTRLSLGGITNFDFIFQADVIGIRDYSFGPDTGQALECANELLLPGPEANSYTGTTFAENGMSLVPEMVSVSQAAAGPLTAGTYEYIATAEWTNDNGDRVMSPASPPVIVVVTGAGDSKPTITGYNIHTTRKSNVLISMHRTALVNSVQTTLHYKVTSQLKGNSFVGPVVYNNDGSNTWTFTDSVADLAAIQNDVLYTDKGLLDRFPCPSFAVGCYAFDRAFVVGPDGAIWFSGEKKEGEALWFHPAQRIVLPTHEEVKAIRQLDNFLLVLCEGSSVFSVAGGPFPDATGAGTIPTPTLLPVTNGCTGFAESTSDGILYTATQGGIWMITRDLRSVFIGAPVQNDTVSGFLGSATDDQQRVMFVTGAGDMVVYDTVTGIWSKWNSLIFSPGIPCPVTSHRGRFVILPGIPSVAYRQKLAQYNDAGTQILSQAWIDFIRLGGIRNYKRVWASQMQGLWLGDHDLSVQMFVDDDAATVVNTYAFTPASSNPLLVELPPGQHELCSSASYLFADSFPRGPSQGFALELMSFYVGLEKGLGRLPATSRIKPT